MELNPYKTRTGSKEWLEEIINGFKFQGVGWYQGGKVLVLDWGDDCYHAHLYHSDPRQKFRDVLELPDKG